MEGLKSLGEQQTLSYPMFELRQNMSFGYYQPQKSYVLNIPRRELVFNLFTLLLSGDHESDHVCDIDKYMFHIELLARAFIRCIDYTNFYSTPSTEGVESTRGNSVCLSVCVFVRNHFFLLRIFNDLMV